MDKGACYSIDIGNIDVVSNKGECSLVNFNVVLMQILNYSQYSILLKLKVDRQDGKGFVDAAILSKTFWVVHNKSCENKLINWLIQFDNIVVPVPICDKKFKYRLEFISGNYVRLFSKESKLSNNRSIVRVDEAGFKRNYCYKKKIGDFCIPIPMVGLTESSIKKLRAKG